jgi:hypothetical protein
MVATPGLGSAFLGDYLNTRNRVFNSGTPPSSPPAMATTTHPITSGINLEPSEPTPKPTIDPALSLELRLRWLEAIVFGVKQNNVDLKRQDITRATEEIQKRLNSVVQSNEGLKKFMDQYDKHAEYLSPAFVLSGTVPSSTPEYQDMSPDELDAFLLELEPDIKAAERDMQEIEVLINSKDVLGAGKLAEYEGLRDRFETLQKSHDEDIQRAEVLEQQIAALIENHSTRIDALSELFVDWDDTLTQVEQHIGRLERDKAEKVRLGME